VAVSDRVHLFAILRFDLFLLETAPLDECVTVKQVVGSQAEAEAEVERLNALGEGDGKVLYTWQLTRWLSDSPPA
jgi:hypothetical protein